MAERPRELDQRFQMGSIWGYYRLSSYFSRHCDTTQFTHGKQTISSTRPSCWIQISTPSTAMREQHCGRPSDIDNTARRSKLTALETISRWLILKSEKRTHSIYGSLESPRAQLYIRRNWTFSLSPTVDTLWAEIGRSWRFSKGSGSLWTQISEGRGHRPPTTLGNRVAEWLPFRVV